MVLAVSFSPPPSRLRRATVSAAASVGASASRQVSTGHPHPVSGRQEFKHTFYRQVMAIDCAYRQRLNYRYNIILNSQFFILHFQPLV